ncbi:MAG TPA: class I SAM-dependent methyltransferase [Acidimicrobiia bacterium]|nr:class I SAM-dependent methyltransferase [Acidimicrobiia bacterium]
MANEIVNVEQAEAWDGPNGQFWARYQERFDATIAPHHALLMEAAVIAPGDRVLDIGCGNGLTTRDAARTAGDRGEALGIDLSGPMLGLARQLAKDEGLTNIRFEQADAQVYPFEPDGFDLVISRFGVMFFNDPVAAFANVASAVRPGGRLAMLVWGPVPDNEWIVAMHAAIAPGQPLPKPPPGTPGPFGLADEDFTRRTLTAAGFADIAFARSEQAFNVGPDVDDAYTFVAELGPVQMLLDGLDETERARALENLRTAVVDHAAPDGVIFRSSAWVVTARHP